MELTMLGTGSALVTECYNTCFVLQEDQQYTASVKTRRNQLEGHQNHFCDAQAY